MSSLTFPSTTFEPVYGWFEQHPGAAAQVWALEEGRAMALLAYCDGPNDAFGWSNWVRAAYEDPSELAEQFERLRIDADDGVVAQLNTAFPGVFAPA